MRLVTVHLFDDPLHQSSQPGTLWSTVNTAEVRATQTLETVITGGKGGQNGKTGFFGWFWRKLGREY